MALHYSREKCSLQGEALRGGTVEEAVYYKSEGAVVYMRATGHVTALVCPPLKAAVFERLDSDPAGGEGLPRPLRLRVHGLHLPRTHRRDAEALRQALGDDGKGQVHRPPRRQRGLQGASAHDRRPGHGGALGRGGSPSPPTCGGSPARRGSSARFLLDAHEELSRTIRREPQALRRPHERAQKRRQRRGDSVRPPRE